MEQSSDTDYSTVKAGYVSVTPLHLDLTHREYLEVLKRDWEDGLDRSFQAGNRSE